MTIIPIFQFLNYWFDQSQTGNDDARKFLRDGVGPRQVADCDRVPLDLLRIENLARLGRALVCNKTVIRPAVQSVLALACLEADGGVVLVKAGQPQSAGVRVKRKSAVVDGTDELYLRVQDIDNF